MNSQVLCVGGPYAGRLVELPRECMVMRFPAWPTAGSVLRNEAMRGRLSDPYAVHDYRWHRSIIGGAYFQFESFALVHESMNSDAADRASLMAAITMSLVLAAASAPPPARPADAPDGPAPIRKGDTP